MPCLLVICYWRSNTLKMKAASSSETSVTSHHFVSCWNLESRLEIPGSFEMWCWRRNEISWTDRVRNGDVLQSAKEERNILHTIKQRKDNWIDHILRRNCLLKHVIVWKIEGRIEMMGRRGKRRKQLLDDLKENRRYWKLKVETVDRFGRSYGPVVRQTTGWMKE
jgi:hypothetical protein